MISGIKLENVLLKLYRLVDERNCYEKAFDAAVAVLYDVLKDRVLLIERVENPLDPWSGHIAFPGGRRENEDLNSYMTSIRELYEEINIKNLKIIHLGPMKTYVSRGVVKVIPHIYLVEEAGEIMWNKDEIKKAEWVLLRELREIVCPQNYTPRCFSTQRFSKIIWGLTGRILGDILDILSDDEA